MNSLAKLGCDVYDKSRALVNVSGQASQEELKLILALTKPSYFMPVHGEAVHLRAHAALGQKMGVPAKNIFVIDNGDSLETTARPCICARTLRSARRWVSPPRTSS